MKLSRRKSVLALAVLALSGAGTALAVGETTGTVVACATSSVAAQTIAVNGTPVSTVPAATNTQCQTTTYTIPTVTSTQTVTTTVATTTTTTSSTGPYSNTAAPTISGSTTVGSTLTADPGTWSPTPPSFYYAWHRCDSSGNCPNVGTNSKTYVLTSADVGQQISLQVAPIDGTGTALWAQSGFASKTAVIASGSIVFDGRAKRLTTLYSTDQYNQAQTPTVWDCLCFNNNSITLASDSRYTQVYKAVVGPGDKNPWNTNAPANDASGQVSNIRPTHLGTWDYYSFAIKVPASGWNNPDWSSIISLGYETIQGDQVALGITNGQWEATQNSGLLTKQPSGWYAGSTAYDTAFMPVAYDVWQEFVIAVKWTTDSTGAYMIYTRQAGQTAWTLVWDKENVPTYAYGTTPYTTVSADMHDCTTVLDKTGLYYGYWSTATTSFPDETIYESGFTRSTDLATAEGAF